ncbi:MAG: Rrf2 family transcriptional regulator [Pseudoflavonifractor sp.]
MLITKETDYALRVLRVLAGGGRRSVPEICREEGIPTGFVYKIVQKLAAAGFLSITRGAEGGCLLDADLEKRTLYDVMTAVGETGLVSACMDPAYPCDWRGAHKNRCSVHCHLAAIQSTVNESMKRYSVASLFTGEPPKA